MGANLVVAWGVDCDGFNPRTRDGCEANLELLNQGSLYVSIHAPVMGANVIPLDILLHPSVSIHAPVMGAKLFIC